MAERGIFQKLRPLALLNHLSSCYDTANLKVFSGSVFWSVYIEEGSIIYASHSIDPFERIERHWRCLDNQGTSIDSRVLTQLRLMLETDSLCESTQIPDYQAICWLVNHQHLDHQQAAVLIEKLVKEVVESFLLVKEGTYELEPQPNDLNELGKFCKLELQPIVECCQKRLQSWQSLLPQIWSPSQRPYFFNPARSLEELLPEHKQQYSAILKGLSFRHLAVLLNQDELQLAESLHPYIKNGTILLHEPLSPFEKLPKIERPTKQLDSLPKPLQQIAKPLDLAVIATESVQKITVQTNNTTEIIVPKSQSIQKNKISPNNNANEKNLKTMVADARTVSQIKKLTENNTAVKTGTSKKSYTIVCVDDSPAMLKEISNFLEDEIFSVFTVNKPVKALMEIVRRKPDLILLDVRMEALDGYELCRLLRNHPLFKNTPIIMVTGNRGIIDKVKAKMVRASDYLTKPFNQKELLKIMFKYLT